jgi:hypothetical protein
MISLIKFKKFWVPQWQMNYVTGSLDIRLKCSRASCCKFLAHTLTACVVHSFRCALPGNDAEL